MIEAAVQTCRHGYTSGNNAQFDEGDDAFHLGVAAASHNFFLVSAVREARMLQRQEGQACAFKTDRASAFP